jgi:hypothetical protein
VNPEIREKWFPDALHGTAAKVCGEKLKKVKKKLPKHYKCLPLDL